MPGQWLQQVTHQRCPELLLQGLLVAGWSLVSPNLAGANRQWLFLHRLWWAGPGRKGYEVISNHVMCSKTQSPAPKTRASGKRNSKRSSSEIDADTSTHVFLLLRGRRLWMEPENPTTLERVSRCHCHVHRLVSNQVP